MKYATMTTAFALFMMAAGSVLAQDRLPAREFTNPQELVVLDQSLPFSEAMRIFQDLSEEFRGKILIDRSGFTGSIGTDISRMHWFDAMNRIAAYNDLVVREFDRYIEVERIPDEEITRVRETEPEPKKDDKFVDFFAREIEIKATFFEASRDVVRDLGIDWTTLRNGRVRVDNIAAARVTDESIRAEINFDDVGGSGWDITALFNALEANNLGEIISSPSVKVLDGERGRVQVGQDFSIRQRDFAGNVIDRFFSTGTILEVEPRIFYHEDETPYIYMTIRAERSTAAPGAITTVVNKQEAETEVLLLSGESTIIAGLYETEELKIRQGVPILKDLPGWFFGLRYLFGYSSTRYDVQELVVLLEVNIVPSLQERLNTRFQNMHELIEQRREEYREMQMED